MKLFADTNFLLDFASRQRADHDAAMSLGDMIAAGMYDAAICASSLKDVYYILRKDYTDSERRDFIDAMTQLFEVLPLDPESCTAALKSDEPDYEDGIIRAVAEKWEADYIVTRDAGGFTRSFIPKIHPDAFLA
jgi:predicted nucleic acid-binding protein